MIAMNETIFNNLMSKADNADKIFEDNYFPTVDELKMLIDVDNVNLYFPIIAYFGKNPYKDNEKMANNREYQDLVIYCEDFTNDIEIVAS